MNEILHLFRKDLHRFRILAALACVLLVADTANVYFHFAPDVRAFRFQLFFEMVVKWPVVFLFVVALMQEDSPDGTRSFWLTRPIEPRVLLGGKLALAATVLVLPYAVGHAVLANAIGSPALVVFFVGVEAAGVMAAVVLLSAVLGAMTRTILQACTVIFAGFAFLFLLFSLDGLPLRLDKLPPPPVTVSTATRIVVTWLFGVVSLLGVLFLHYRQRRLALTIPVLAASIIGTLFGGRYWPLQLIAEPTSVPNILRAPPAAPTSAPKIDLTVRGAPYESGYHRVYDSKTRQFLTRRYVALPVLQGTSASGRYVRIESVKSELIYADGTRRVFEPAHSQFLDRRELEKTITATLGLPPPTSQPVPSPVNFFAVDPTENPAPPDKPARLEAQLHLVEHTYSIVARLPLHRGAALTRDGETWLIDSVQPDTRELSSERRDHSPGSVLVQTRLLHATSLLYPRGIARPDNATPALPLGFVLHNRRLNEFVIGSTSRRGSSNEFSGFLSEQTLDINFSVPRGSDRTKPATGLDAAWLADAELLILASERTTSFEQTLTVEKFSFAHEENPPPPFWQ